MLKKYFIMAIAAGLALVACSEKFDEPEILPAGSDNVHTLSVGIEAGTYTPAEGETKASMEAVVRVNWTVGDKVSVVNATTGKILGGCLEAKDAGVSVTFEGTVTGTINPNDKLYYIYPRVDQNDSEVGFENDGYGVSLAGQTYDGNNPGRVSFYGYAEDVAGSNTISKKIQFTLVTSYAHLNMANLPATGCNLSSIDISKVNKGFKWSLTDSKELTADAYGENEGISVNCSNCKITQAGNAVVRFAIPASAATGSDSRVVTVNKAYTNDKYVKDELKSSAYYNQLYTSWESKNVSVSTPAGSDKTEVTIDNLGSTETAEGILPVASSGESAFAADKPTEISLGGLGTITFNQQASNAIKTNAGESTSVFFKVEDVTQSKPVDNANLVYEITMKTLDNNGTEVFSKNNAGENSEATVVIQLGQSVSSVESVSLVDENGISVSGNAVKDVNFNNETGTLTFTVIHFSKYAIKYTEKQSEQQNYVAQIGGRKYETLASVIAAAQNGNTIQMIADYTASAKIEIGADKNIVLDLNGKKISYTADACGTFIENRGQLKVKDSGSNGVITAKFNNPNWSDGCYTINNAGTYDKPGKLVIESGTIENTSPAGLAWPISNGIYGTNADLVINGGTIHSTNYVPVREYLQCGGKKTIVINGGKFISDNSRAIAVQVSDATIQDTGSSVTINGGEFTCNGSGILYVDMHAANANLSGFSMIVNGGKFKNSNTDAPVLAYDYENHDHESAVLLSKILKGGTYSQKPASELLADGYAVKQNTDGSWTVEIENFWPNFAASSFSNINESAKTITISSPAELALLAKKINGGTSYAGYTISINGNLDMGAHYWIPINAYSKGSISGATIMGVNSATIANLMIEKAIYKGNYDYYAGFIAQAAGGVTFKDLTFSGAVSVDNGSGVATVLGQTYGNVLFDNVKVVNSTVSAETKAGSLLGFTGGDGIKVTVKDCSLDNVTVKAEYSYALMVGLVNTNDKVVFEGSNTATNSHAVLDETIAASDFPTRKTIKGYTYGVNGTKLWVIGVQDAWAECRTDPTPKKTIDGVEYSVMGDKFYHADGVVVDICAPDPVAKIGNTGYATLEAAINAASATDVIELFAGEYTTYGTNYAHGKTLTFKGIEGETIWKYGKNEAANGEGGSDYSFEGSTVTFNNIILEDNYTGNSYYRGFVRAAGLTFNNCTLKNMMGYLGIGDVHFTNCVFDVASVCEYAVKTYSGNKFYFDGCIFKGNNKANIQLYRENTTNKYYVQVKDCKFYRGDDKSKTAVYFYDPGTAGGAYWEIHLDGNNENLGEIQSDSVSGSWLWGTMKQSTTDSQTTIYVGDKLVWEKGAKVE